MTERVEKQAKILAQEMFEKASGAGFVEDFIEDGAGDFGFFSLTPQKKEVWLEIVEANPSLLDEPPFLQ